MYNYVKHGLKYIDEEKLLTFKKKILWKIHRPVQTGEYEKKNEDLKFNKLNIRLFLKVKRLEWAGHVWQAAESLIRNVLIKKSPQKIDQEEGLTKGG